MWENEGRVVRLEANHRSVVTGVIWTVIFSGMSFYWAMGGQLGLKSLGGSIYEMSQNPDPSFVRIVWLTGFVKLLGIPLLLGLYVKWKKPIAAKAFYYVTKAAGICIFLYGFLNFITIALSALGILDFDLEASATFWRLVFWEPFWMIGGMFYFFAVKRGNTA
ncbi:DUF3995 domain-containing protein [Paenibacillus senegalensis]|uniref:DUF3995 domain-containing protein n=1 Tax=Paenibacillus senegalensis TaxID=1465766 RepID=UPI0002894B6D|nr:DUF3995 domain-containing protein [Paenibacillus senegalensis]